MTTEKLVLHYLIRNSHFEVAQKFAMKTSLNMDQEIHKDMATVYEDFKNFLRGISETNFENTPDRLNNLSTPSQFKDTDELKFSRSNTKGGGVILNYKEFQYSKDGAKMGKGTTYWKCRFHSKLKCCGYLHLKDGKVKKLKEHTHEASVGKMEISSMGTSDTTLRYSKTRMKGEVLHFRGYEYILQRRIIDGRVNWFCRQRQKKVQRFSLHKKWTNRRIRQRALSFTYQYSTSRETR